LPREGVVEGGAEIGFSSNCTKNNFRPPARDGQAEEKEIPDQVGDDE
jgi:hypothetical protein